MPNFSANRSWMDDWNRSFELACFLFYVDSSTCLVFRDLGYCLFFCLGTENITYFKCFCFPNSSSVKVHLIIINKEIKNYLWRSDTFLKDKKKTERLIWVAQHAASGICMCVRPLDGSIVYAYFTCTRYSNPFVFSVA